MSDSQLPDDDRPDELSYEDLDDLWSDEEERAPIEIDAEIDIEDENAEIEESSATPQQIDTAPVEHDKATEDFLESLDELDDEIEDESEPPQRVTIWASEVDLEAEEVEKTEAAAPETAPAVPAETGSQPDESEASALDGEEQPAEPAPSAAAELALTYRVMIMLPSDLGAQVLELRELGGVEDMPPPGIALGAAFQTADLPAVEKALTGWARAHLPLQLEVTGVLAEVIGANQYVAGWTLQPEEELDEAHDALIRALAPCTTAQPGAPAPPHMRITVGEHMAPRPFPGVIGQMQRDYEPYVWHAESISLLQAGAEAWKVTRTFD